MASKTDRRSLYQEVTDQIISELEAGRVPWVQPWGTPDAKASLGLPKNANLGRAAGQDDPNVFALIWNRPRQRQQRR